MPLTPVPADAEYDPPTLTPVPADARLDPPMPPGYQRFGGYGPTASPNALGGNYHGSILPFSTDAQGKPSFDWQAGIPGALTSAIGLPGQVASGEVQTPYSSTGRMDPDLMPRTVGLASTLMMDAPGVQLPRTAAPSGQELKTIGNAGYERLNNSGITIKGSEVSNHAGDMSQNLTHQFWPPVAAPQTHAMVDELAKFGDLTFPAYNALHKRFNDIIMTEPKEAGAAKIARDHLESLWENLQDSQMRRSSNQLQLNLGGEVGSTPTMTGPEAAMVFREARENRQGAFKSDELVGGLGKGDTGMLQQAEGRAAATNSGQNAGNLVRQRLATFLANDKNLIGYSPEEIAALYAVRDGSSYQNALRYLGNRGTMMSAIGALFGEGGAASAVGVAAGQGVSRVLKGLESGVARRGLQQVDEMVRQNTPLGRAYEGTPSPYPRSPPTVPARPQLVSPPSSGRLIAPGLLTPKEGQPIPWWQLEGRA